MQGDRQKQLHTLLQRKGAPLPAQRLLAELKISQPTLSRLVQLAGPAVVRIGKARATRYALTRDLGRMGSQWMLYRIDGKGAAQTLGQLHALQHDCWYFQASAAVPALLHGEFRDGLFPGLPWFLDDQRPQGFLGRAFVQRLAPLIGAQHDLKLWRSDDVVLALLLEGFDACGDLVLGEANLERAQRHLFAPEYQLSAQQRNQFYPELAAAALRGDVVGSSAGGEQPKFAITLHAANGWQPVIVKFSDRRSTPAGQRWSDLLHCEFLASEVLRAHGLPAAHNEIISADDRCFLQSTRFDRTAQLGRIGMVSLAALDAAFYGHGRIDWWRWAPQLERDGWLDRTNAQQLSQLNWFGALIGNADMHLGNAALLQSGNRPLSLAPAYDMSPMHWRPSASGEIIERDILPVAMPPPEQIGNWRVAALPAAVFWQEVIGNPEISPTFKKLALAQYEQLQQVRERLG